jgi:hypothetical protein
MVKSVRSIREDRKNFFDVQKSKEALAEKFKKEEDKLMDKVDEFSS